MHFSLVKINPPEALPSHGFDDVILPVYYALKRLGYEAEILFNAVNPRSRNIVFGSCINPRPTGRMLPRGSIIFNLEQINPDNKWCNRNYLTHLKDFAVWEYSRKNVAALRELGHGQVTHVPLGYVPEMTRLRTDLPRQTDLLFYGLITESRKERLDKILARGIGLLASQEAFGNLRDRLLSGSRLLLNLHSQYPARLEVVRLGYVWANKIPVLSERREDTEIPEHLLEACVYARAEDLPEAAARLLADPAGLEALAEKGFKAYSSRLLQDGLEKVLGRRIFKIADPQTGLRPSAPEATAAKPGAEPEEHAYLLRPAREWLIRP